MSENFSEMTARELKEYAQINDIDLGDTKTKTGIISILTGTDSSLAEALEASESLDVEEKRSGDAIMSVIPERTAPLQSNLASENNDGVVASKAANRKDPIVEKEVKDVSEKVALWSPKSITWENIGRLTPGYNIVSKEASEKWLTRNGIRIATPEEMATYYGK
jgi:hypothetical protein